MDYREKYAPHMMALCAFCWALVMIKFTYIDKLEDLNYWFGLAVFAMFIFGAVSQAKKNKRKLNSQASANANSAGGRTQNN
ncbi:hypothetical protein IB292_03060 [Vibrio parahaemolyticus]|uniref:Uncharacterized protein n=1 Tax=Vibrio parahaemolyticus TaxID=670 RepID=A0A9Q3YG75_VIBPH|nr:hypothetical protein [Vibrio parahaemolyticus]MCC3804011.1 hypothetical protein [Vibrio parahaemolyticus]